MLTPGRSTQTESGEATCHFCRGAIPADSQYCSAVLLMFTRITTGKDYLVQDSPLDLDVILCIPCSIKLYNHINTEVTRESIEPSAEQASAPSSCANINDRTPSEASGRTLPSYEGSILEQTQTRSEPSHLTQLGDETARVHQHLVETSPYPLVHEERCVYGNADEEAREGEEGAHGNPETPPTSETRPLETQ